jgi:nicotinate-nucleotide adenylyltransferase
VIGFFGGSFDPFHNAHRALAEAALGELKLDRLIVMPTANPPHRGALLFSADERLALTRAGLAGLSGAEVSDLEARSHTPQYTIETLQHLSQTLGRKDWVICLGADSFLTLDQWHRASELMATYPCAVAPRTGVDQALVDEKARRWGQTRGLRVLELKTTLPAVSATAVREALEQGLNTDHLLPAGVTACLKSMGPRAKTDD